jgi:hypothetical protein
MTVSLHDTVLFINNNIVYIMLLFKDIFIYKKFIKKHGICSLFSSYWIIESETTMMNPGELFFLIKCSAKWRTMVNNQFVICKSVRGKIPWYKELIRYLLTRNSGYMEHILNIQWVRYKRSSLYSYFVHVYFVIVSKCIVCNCLLLHFKLLVYIKTLYFYFHSPIQLLIS